MYLFSDAGSDKSNERTESSLRTTEQSVPFGPGTPNEAKSDAGSITGLVTARFKHIVTEEGHAVITGRDGETLQRCEDEPIHIPGAVQSFGLLVALEEKEEGQLVVRVVSENSHRMIGYTPKELFQLDSFCDILSEEQQENILDHIDFIRDEDADPASNGPEVFTITVRLPNSPRRSQKLWCAMHINPANSDLIICEFELDDDHLYPLIPPDEEKSWPPEDTLHSKPTEEEYIESTIAMSKPLRVLRSARKRRGEAAAMEVFNIMSQVQEQLAAAPSLETFLKILVGVVKELTGFHRVMIYQFDSVFNGRVVTELVDPRATKDLYKGLNFPASDIPKQARELYKINKVRLLYDRDLESARLVCRTIEDLETPLDLSFAYLRAMSPIHIKYLTNMAVRSSMSISINAFGDLWGLISCHGYGSKGMRVSFPIRKMCRLIGDTASRNIEKLSYASRLQARKLINTVPTKSNPSGYIIASSDDLLKLFDADFGLLSIKGETKILGKLEQSQEALAMLEYLRLRKITSVITSQDIREDFPDLKYPPGFVVISGLLLVPLSVGGTDFIVFFRRGGIKEIKWAGNPYEKFIKEGTEGYLEPRKSFRAWSETIVGKCREWTDEQAETAAVLCLVYGKFIEVWRQKEAALQNSQLTRLLLANSAHEVRTPLNAIINYLEIALEGVLDQETRDNLSKSHSASKSLIYVINDLLDLTNTEEGQELIKDEVFDLPLTIRETAESFRGDAKRKGLEYEVIEHPGLPQLVQGDQRRVRQAVSNITANAFQNTTNGWIRIELYLQEIIERRATVEIVVQDSGAGMSSAKLDALFRDLEQVTTDEDDGNLLGSSSHQFPETEGIGRTLGLGLAIVARIVRNMDGQLRLKSEEGVGSRFVIQLPFILPDEDADSAGIALRAASLKSTQTSPRSAKSGPPIIPLLTDGERTLVEKGSSIKSVSVTRQRSLDEINSLRSFRSTSSNFSGKSTKSDVDRLIDAISQPINDIDFDETQSSLHQTAARFTGRPESARSSVYVPHDKPGLLKRTQSHGSPDTSQTFTGRAFFLNERTPIKAIKIPNEFAEPQSIVAQSPPQVSFDTLDNQEQNKSGPKEKGKEIPTRLDAEHLKVLVAEDDPVNSRIIKKRMEKAGHEVHSTINGEECATAYSERPAHFDVVLMDMQMPIVDGLTSAKMIRAFEKAHPDIAISARAASNGRVPIFAVSASLMERNRQEYIDAGFDGWILKPIDFQRLNTLLTGIVEYATRKSCLYKAGKWENGGWFQKSQSFMKDAKTKPFDKTPMQKPSQHGPEALQAHVDAMDSNKSEVSSKGGSGEGSAGSLTPTSKSDSEMKMQCNTGDRHDLPPKEHAHEPGGDDPARVHNVEERRPDP
ncbi:putative cyanobacterial phytochrome B [Bisporella sp. PMI_857]|nr:putative cyanobacterial phytochrome B [Bisporella sp. PMI_857]